MGRSKNLLNDTDQQTEPNVANSVYGVLVKREVGRSLCGGGNTSEWGSGGDEWMDIRASVENKTHGFQTKRRRI